MSSLSGWYAGVDGTSAFVAGVAAALADEKLSGIMPRYCCMETDVLEANKDNLCERFSERIYAYERLGHGDKAIPKRELRLELEPVAGSPQECLEGIIMGNAGKTGTVQCDNENARRRIGEFFSDIRFQLGEAKAVHALKRPYGKAVEKVFSSFYTYMVFAVYFVEYEEYFLMLVFGSNE